MTLERFSPTPGALLAIGLLLGVAGAQAGPGYTVDARQDALVSVGMSQAEVRQLLGRPQTDISYRNQPGSVYTYRVAGIEPTVFEIDFDSDGKVASATEVPGDSGHGHR